MEMINRAFYRAISLHAVMCGIMIAAIILCVYMSRKKDSMAIYAIAIGAWLIIYGFTSIVPFVKDCVTQDVIQINATYINNTQSKSFSSRLGEYSVVLETPEESINLTTVPFSRDVFPTGKYSVTAWYTKNSKRLLYIEILNLEE